MKVKGFTLIELMIVVVVVAILAAVAYPSYLNSVRKSRRADGIAGITAVQLAQEKLRASCANYGEQFGTPTACGADETDSTITASATSPDGHYNIAVDVANAANSTDYTVTATGVGDQANDEAGGVTCTLVVTVTALNPNGLRTPSECW